MSCNIILVLLHCNPDFLSETTVVIECFLICNEKFGILKPFRNYLFREAYNARVVWENVNRVLCRGRRSQVDIVLNFSILITFFPIHITF